MTATTTTFLLDDGVMYEPSTLGVYTATELVDWSGLAQLYIADQDATDEAARENHSNVSAERFVKWLIKRGVLVPMKVWQHSVDVSRHPDKPYLPAHWPLCPDCGEGRGDPDVKTTHHCGGTVSYTVVRICTECGHQWEIPGDEL